MVIPMVLQFLRIGYDEFEITACWATILAPGAEHKAHSHPNNFLSGVYYLQTSISFNVMFSAFTENLTKPLWSSTSDDSGDG